MPTYNTDCLKTTVKNTSGLDRTFTCLPGSPRIGSGDEYSFNGDLVALVAGVGGAYGRRKLKSLAASMASGALTIIKRPEPILANDAGDPKMLAVTGTNTVEAVAPTFTESESET